LTIVNGSGSPVSGATVSGTWSGAASENDSGTTDSQGKVTLYSGWQWNNQGPFQFCVTNITKSGWVYNTAANNQTCDSDSY